MHTSSDIETLNEPFEVGRSYFRDLYQVLWSLLGSAPRIPSSKEPEHSEQKSEPRAEADDHPHADKTSSIASSVTLVDSIPTFNPMEATRNLTSSKREGVEPVRTPPSFTSIWPNPPPQRAAVYPRDPHQVRTTSSTNANLYNSYMFCDDNTIVSHHVRVPTTPHVNIHTAADINNAITEMNNEVSAMKNAHQSTNSERSRFNSSTSFVSSGSSLYSYSGSNGVYVRSSRPRAADERRYYLASSSTKNATTSSSQRSVWAFLVYFLYAAFICEIVNTL